MILSDKEKAHLSKLTYIFGLLGLIGVIVCILTVVVVTFLTKNFTEGLTGIAIFIAGSIYCAWGSAAFFTLSKYPGCIPKNKRWLAPKWLENSVHTWITGDPYYQHNQRQAVYGFAVLCFFTGFGITLFHGKYFIPCFLIGALGYVWIRSRPHI